MKTITHPPNISARESIAHRGAEFYERNIKAIVEPKHHGDYLVLDIDSGVYEIDKDEVTVMLRASENSQRQKVRFANRVSDDGIFESVLSPVGYHTSR